jgi:transcription elongation factor GreA
MASEKLQLTQENYNAQEREMKALKEQLEEVNKQLREARGFGDLSENAEYDAAREEKRRIEDRISELSASLRSAEIVDLEELMKYGVVAMVGTIVEVEDENGKVMRLNLVGTTNTDSLAGSISNESPVGAALMGHGEGEQVSYATPSGKLRMLTIRKITVPDTKADKQD